MKAKFVCLILALLVIPVCWTAPQAAPAPAEPALRSTNRLPGVDLAEGFSVVTGVAISPLLGVTAIGACRYWRTPLAQRPSLPWFCHPWAWGTGLFLLAACFLKDALGAGAPPLVKKPLDILELFENKLSALIASAAFIPFVVAQMTQHLSPASLEQAVIPAQGLAMATPVLTTGMAMHFLLLPLAIAAFGTVWLASHSVHALIVFSPHGLLDAALKLCRTGVLCTLALFYFVSPFLAAAVSLVILIVSALTARFAFRITVFGTVMAWDLLRSSQARRAATPMAAHAFIARKSVGLPVRTYGRVSRGADGIARFTYRPWLLLPRRTVMLDSGDWAISKGLLFPSLLHRGAGSVNFRSAVHFLPRYRGLETTLAEHLGGIDIRAGSWTRNLAAMREWLTEWLQPGILFRRKQSIQRPLATLMHP